jgi:hypothetical protein
VKNGRYIALAIGLVVLLIAGAGYFALMVARSESIINVYNQKVQSAKDCTIEIKNLRAGTVVRRRFNWVKFVGEIQQINASACPKKFRLAWLDFVQACQRESEQRPNSDLFLWLFGVATKRHTFDSLPMKPIEAADELEKASQALDRVATEYNVRIIYNPTN